MTIPFNTTRCITKYVNNTDAVHGTLRKTVAIWEKIGQKIRWIHFFSVIQNNSLLSKHKIPMVPMPTIGTKRLTHSFIISMLLLIILVPVTCICTGQQLHIMARKSYTSSYSYIRTIKTFTLTMTRNLELNYRTSVKKIKAIIPWK